MTPYPRQWRIVINNIMHLSHYIYFTAALQLILRSRSLRNKALDHGRAGLPIHKAYIAIKPCLRISETNKTPIFDESNRIRFDVRRFDRSSTYAQPERTLQASKLSLQETARFLGIDFQLGKGYRLTLKDMQKNLKKPSPNGLVCLYL